MLGAGDVDRLWSPWSWKAEEVVLALSGVPGVRLEGHVPSVPFASRPGEYVAGRGDGWPHEGGAPVPPGAGGRPTTLPLASLQAVLGSLRPLLRYLTQPDRRPGPAPRTNPAILARPPETVGARLVKRKYAEETQPVESVRWYGHHVLLVLMLATPLTARYLRRNLARMRPFPLGLMAGPWQNFGPS